MGATIATNSEAFAVKFTGELDKVLVQKSKTGFLTDNALRAKFVGAKTVKIPNISLQGLGDYDRENGFIKGVTTIDNEAFELTMDRARTFSIDREDLDETGIQSLAGQVLSEFVRTKVVPETDAYVLSKLAGLAKTNGNTVAAVADKPFETFMALQNKVIEKSNGTEEELVCFMDYAMYNSFVSSSEIQKIINVENFKQGDVDLKVKKIDGIALIPVVSGRMRTAYVFNADGDGGFTPTGAAQGIKMLMLPKKAASLIRKSEKMRVFTPDVNQAADAYKFDYRLYYDVLVKTSMKNTVCAVIE